MARKCPFCSDEFPLMGGSLETRQNEEEWKTTLFYHLYWTHEKELQNNRSVKE